MIEMDFFPSRPELNPRIYAYEDSNPKYKGLLKVGYTTKDVESRVAQQYPTKRPEEHPYRIVLDEAAIRDDGSTFTDKAVHRILKKRGFENPNGEWFRCGIGDVRSAIIALQTRTENEENRTQNFKMRPEQDAAVKKTVAYYTSYKKENPDKTPHFLWNAKMRFGKTFATYELAKQMGFRKVLVLTFKPAVQSAWEEDLMTHIDFEGWQFITRGGLTYEEADKTRPFVCFASFQDFLGKNSSGGIKLKNHWAHEIEWDLVVFDEYHYGAWRETAKELFESEDKKEQSFQEGSGMEYFKDGFDEELLPIKTSYYLYLSGTPFRAIASGEFIEEQIYNWTYSDEQKAKETWVGENNPYEMMPRMVLMTYQLPQSVVDVASGGEFDQFDLNEFFAAEGEGENARFKHEDEVQKWLDIIRGAHSASDIDELKLGAKKPPMPYSDTRLLGIVNHSFWFLPRVSSCFAMANLLKQKQNVFYHDYTINIAAGSKAGIGVDALDPVRKSMKDPLRSKTITLSCGKLTTGVTIKPWSAIFMLRNLTSPETYFQAAFRVQSPWVIDNEDSPTKKEIMKKECYVFDFAPNRALKQIADYSCRLNIEETNPEHKVQEFINFLPVLAYDGSSMKQIDAAGVLEYAMSGTTATLLARRWESALLVNVDNNTLSRILNNPEALRALSNIEGFRNLNDDIQTIINKSEAIKAKKKSDQEPTPREKKEMTEEEKELKSKRKMIQEKLIKFATRIPIFMYLTDYRECCLKDVITKLEPGLFKKVTGLEVKDFELLVSLGVFNASLMNDAVYKFKRYEDSSLSYTGIYKHEGQEVGLWDTAIGSVEFENGLGSKMPESNILKSQDNSSFGNNAIPTNRGMSVTRKARSVKQPRGGYIHPQRLKMSTLSDGKELGPENIDPSIVGLAVDYLTRYIMGAELSEAFVISVMGGMKAGKAMEVAEFMAGIKGLDDESIENACRTCMFDSYYRAGKPPSMEPNQIHVDKQTCENIRTMVNRSKTFFEKYGPIIESGPSFPGAYTDVVKAGDGDYLTKDTIWDFKVSKNPPTKEQTLQLAMYYIMGKHSTNSNFESVTKIGIFNPRKNKVYTFDMNNLEIENYNLIEKNIIGYKERVIENKVTNNNKTG